MKNQLAINRLIKKSRPNLIKILDRIYSKYIRLRDSNGDIGNCISCGRPGHWKNCDAGHFINRAEMAVRYDERNVNLQCRHCNRFREGNPAGYVKGLEAKYGSDIIEELRIKSKLPMKLDRIVLAALILNYRYKVKDLENPDVQKRDDSKYKDWKEYIERNA